MGSSIKLKDIIAELTPEGWEVLSDRYINLDTEMQFKCSKGHLIQSTWRRLRKTMTCPVCALDASSDISGKVVAKKAHTTRLMSLDQATHTTGFAIFDNTTLIHAGVFQNLEEDEGQRYVNFRTWYISMIDLWKPDQVIFEGIQMQENLEGGMRMGVTTFEKLARLQGVIIETSKEYNIKYKIVPTNTWRGHVGVMGKSRADKKTSARNLVSKAYGRNCTDDEADAILIGKYGVDQIIKEDVPIMIWE